MEIALRNQSNAKTVISVTIRSVDPMTIFSTPPVNGDGVGLVDVVVFVELVLF